MKSANHKMEILAGLVEKVQSKAEYVDVHILL